MKYFSSIRISRREFVRRSALGAAGLTLGAATVPSLLSAPAGKIPVGVQLYSVREQCKTDLLGTLAAIARMGYKGVEFAGYHGKPAKELRQMLDGLGLVTCGTHTPYESILPDKLAETIEFNRTIGNKFLIVPWMTGKTKQDWLDKAKLFNEAAEKVKAQGMWVGYHAHAQIDGAYGYLRPAGADNIIIESSVAIHVKIRFADAGTGKGIDCIDKATSTHRTTC